MTVGVMNDDDFYLGEVTAVKSDSLGTVNFMDRSIIRDDTYRWPAIVDETDVNMKYVSGALDFQKSAPVRHEKGVDNITAKDF